MKDGESMKEPEKELIPTDFKKLYDSLGLTERISIDSIISLSFILLQNVQETARAAVMQALQEAQNNQNK